MTSTGSSSGSNTGSAKPGTAERSHWFMRELGSALAGDDADDATRDEIARLTMRNSHEGFERLVMSRYDPGEVVCVEFIIERASGGCCHVAYRGLPSPVELLFLCAQTCFDGDVVKLRQVTAVSGSVTTSERWPFGLMSAEQLTIPAAERLRERATRVESERGSG
jgi:hypothetical protein